MSEQEYAGFDAVVDEPEAPVEPDEAEETPETEPEEAEQTPEEPGERLYAGKYKTIEEMERAYEEAQSKLGRLADQVGNQQPPQPPRAPVNDPTEAILRMPVSKLAADTGEWDEWVAERYGYDPLEMTEADWLEVKTDLKSERRERESRQRAEAENFQRLDREITSSFGAQFPEFTGNPVLTAAAQAVTAQLWAEVQQGVRAFDGAEAFAKLVGVELKAQLAPVGPAAMGAYNARQAAQRPAGVPAGNVAPGRAPRREVDPNEYRGF